MSLYLSLDGGEPTDLASNRGWSEFLDWSGDADAKQYPQMAIFTDHGWSQELTTLRKELMAYRKENAPPRDVASVLDNLLSLLATNVEVASVTDGVSNTEA